MAGLSALEVSLDVPKFTKHTQFVLSKYGDVCWHTDIVVLEQKLLTNFTNQEKDAVCSPASLNQNPRSYIAANYICTQLYTASSGS